MSNTVFSIVKSWATKEGNVNGKSDILKWIENLNSTVKVSIIKNKLEDSEYWYYEKDEGSIVNKNRSFFSIRGLQKKDACKIIDEHPIIIQNEIGYLGLICKEIDGVINFLMQAKIEPGNINKIQISPTIQATKSNFTQKHGGNKPLYFDYFIDASSYEVVVDQIQSEQSSRFYKKRNRNIIIRVDDDIEVLPNYKWMTLGQIKELMKIDNLVNMDTRTVISCIPFSNNTISIDEIKELEKLFDDKELFKSIFYGEQRNMLPAIYQYINNYKMFDESNIKLVDIYSLNDWYMKDGEYICKNNYPFKIVFCDIEIEGREVRNWTQPLFEATGISTFGLIMYNDNGIKKFIIKAVSENGCFDKIELGPSIQNEAGHEIKFNEIDKLFYSNLENNRHIVYDCLLSEEGGRFYHEQNRNVIMQIPKTDLINLPTGYFAVDYKTLNNLVQINNCLNIQLRNLLSLLEA